MRAGTGATATFEQAPCRRYPVPEFRIEDVFRVCRRTALQPVRYQVKTDRFQQSGHTSVEIRSFSRLKNPIRGRLLKSYRCEEPRG